MTRLRSSVPIYGSSLALLTDLYQLTMAYGYWKSGMAEREAVFHLYFRDAPFRGGFALAGGLAHAIEFIERFAFDESDLLYLSGLLGDDGSPLFDAEFLELLRSLRLRCDVDAVPEGSLVFPAEPLVRIGGPLLHAQLFETPLLNAINFQTLIATKAARIALAARGEPILEFGLRRAHGIDGGLAVSRAAYLGGCAATSNLLAGKLFDIPVRGTHAHSWVMSFDDELESFRAYAAALPNNCIFLVDTYDSLEGVQRAVEVGRSLRERGHRMAGIRLDSGDLAALSQAARAILDEAGFRDARIVASNDLDEAAIAELVAKGAPIAVFGVGTRLATAYDQPALGGVYKLAAIRDRSGAWSDRLKLSDDAAKTSNPGAQQVRRFEEAGEWLGDVIHDANQPLDRDCDAVDLADPNRRRRYARSTPSHALLVPIFREGNRVYQPPPLAASRAHAAAELSRLPERFKRLRRPARYPVGLEASLHERKAELIARAGRGGEPG